MSFEESLWNESRRGAVAGGPLVQAIANGTCPRPVAAAYMMEVAELAYGFPRMLCAILAVCPERRARLSLMANLLEEEGVEVFEAHKTFTAPIAKHHGTMALRLARALGAPEVPLPLPYRRSAWVEAALARGEWLGPLAFVTVGYEASVPPVFGALAAGLRTHYGCGAGDLAYLIDHVEADAEHAADGIELLAALATTPAGERAALEGARLGVRSWAHVHRKYAHRMARFVAA
jgi:pyrroloquinoline quinone (PQQ) biosynthesis protein C